jgi:hypothetical protein
MWQARAAQLLQRGDAARSPPVTSERAESFHCLFWTSEHAIQAKGFLQVAAVECAAAKLQDQTPTPVKSRAM